MSTGAHRVQRKVLDPLESQACVISQMWLLGTDPGPSTRALHVLYH